MAFLVWRAKASKFDMDIIVALLTNWYKARKEVLSKITTR